MKILILYTMLFSALNTGCSNDGLKDVSKEISDQQLSNGIRSGSMDYYHDIRLKLIELSKLTKFDDADTIFFLETYDIENANFYGKIWSINKELIYTYNQGNFTFDDGNVFSTYTCELIEKWDVEKIRQEEEENSTMTNPLQIYGSRVIKKKDTLSVDCILFKEFFLLERDR